MDTNSKSNVKKAIEKNLSLINNEFKYISAIKETSEPWDGFQQNQVDDFCENLVQCESDQKKDLLIWKFYSRSGGFYDLLCDFETAITKPTINAFDFDEDEKCYNIYITINNSLLSRFNQQIKKMEEQLKEISDHLEIPNDAKKLLSLFNNVKQSHKNIMNQTEGWIKEIESYNDQYSKLSKPIPPSAQNVISIGKKHLHKYVKPFETIIQKKLSKSETPSNEESLLTNTSQLLKTMQYERKNYEKNLDNYQSQQRIFERNRKALLSYVVTYTSLYEKIHALQAMTNVGGALHGLTCSPSTEEDIDKYMQLAQQFHEKALEITNEYPL